MRTLLVFLLVLALVIGGLALFLFATTPKTSAGVSFPLTAAQVELIGRVPASADAFAYVPTAALFHHTLVANPVTRDLVAKWDAEQPLPAPWMLGGADVIVWRDGKRTGYAIRVDTFRAFLIRIWMMWSSDIDARWDGKAFVINGSGGARMKIAASDTTGLPPGDVFAMQLNRERGAFPPIGRPAVSSVKVSAGEIVIVSRSGPPASSPAGAAASRAAAPKFAQNAMLSAWFARPPRLLGDLKRLIGTDVNTLVSDGGSIILYDVDTGTLLPRPKGVISVPADDRRRAAMADINRLAELVGESHDTGKELLVSFDRGSMPLYLKDAFEPATWPATDWAVRMDPQKLVPVLENAGDSTGLRIASGRLYRAARDLRRWISALKNAKSIEAAASTTADAEELRVRIASK